MFKNVIKTKIKLAHDIIEMAVIQPFAFDQNGLNGGTSTKIVCTITAGDSPVQISWYKDDLPLRESDKNKVLLLDDTTSMLSMKKLDLEDSATYSCQANNAAGVTKYSSVLRVKGIESQLWIFSALFEMIEVAISMLVLTGSSYLCIVFSAYCYIFKLFVLILRVEHCQIV